MAWANIQNGESMLSVRGKINTLGNEVEVNKLSNVIVINNESDFPNQDANNIILGAGAELGAAYVFGADVTTSKNVVISGNCVIKSESVFTK